MRYLPHTSNPNNLHMTRYIMWSYQDVSSEGSPNRLLAMDMLLPKTQDNDLRSPQQGPQNEATVAEEEGTQSKFFPMTICQAF
ncbi:hypothetical protein FAGAP_6597 [Fusarium agapanthi]|uniref:Uncharacterized protein n=1 Tax=Fusarium agapanthi TaxID=1803897 RepID=A0A9P5B8Y1_9HYPO|nr:hypothetical protein FAGAP_6597 [Fusarium agapanthi]